MQIPYAPQQLAPRLQPCIAPTSRSVAVLAHCPSAMVAMSGLITSIVSRIETME